jgi:hypothetical protein
MKAWCVTRLWRAAGARWQGKEIAIDSTGIRHAPAPLAGDDAQKRSRWVHPAETSRIGGRPNLPLQLPNAPTIVDAF